MLARTLRTGKSDSRARSPLSSTTPARSGPSGDLVSSSLAVAGGAAGRALDAGERAEELHLPVALGAGDPEDLALRDLEVDRAEPLAAQARDGEQHLAVGAPAPCRSGKASWSGRPIISATRLSSDMPAASNVPWQTPSRRTVTRSAMPSTSGSRWLT